jgi:xanthine phosphoribosyltransferase
MELLKQRIIADGVAIGTEILKVDSFLNHQIDVKLFEQIGEAFAERFADIGKIDRILTVEASGIAVACFVARYFGYPPVVFAKKAKPNTMTEDAFAASIYSFTKNTETTITVSKKYIHKGEKVLIIDDFLAHGYASLGMADIIKEAEATPVGVGIVIEKQFQGGAERLKEAGLRVESLAVVSKINNGLIEFAN